MKLDEITEPAPQLSKIERVEKWLWDNNIDVRNYTIRPDGIVDVDGDVNLCERRIGKALPIQFGNVTGKFDCSLSSLTTLKGCPQFVGTIFSCSGTNITSLDFAPQSIGTMDRIGSYFWCHNTNVTSLHNIHKTITCLHGRITCPYDVTHILGLLLIEKIELIDIVNGPINNIMNKYLGTGDIISAQDELIDAGFMKQARL